MRCLFTMFCLCGIAAQAATTDERVEKVDKVKSISAQASEKGITVSLALPEKVYAGAEIPLVVSVKNQGKNGINYSEITKYRDCHLEIVDSKGNAVPLTRFGKTEVGDDKPVFRVIERILQGGKELKVTLNLARVFDLTMGGDYAVTITRKFNEDAPEGFKVTVSKFAFQVQEPAK